MAEAETKEKITVKIDGEEVEVEKGTTILNAANILGIDIPTLCYHPAVSTFGACRICSVEITDERGRKDIVTSCNYPIKSEIEVETQSERVRDLRKMLLEFLLARAPKAEKIQELAEEYGVEEPSLWVEDEEETCILCGLCTRVCEELVNLSAINFANRGVRREVDAPFHDFSEDCIGCGTCGMVCPTTAIESQRNIFPTLEEDEEEIEREFLEGEKDEDIGVYTDLFAAKSELEGQDGGMATALLLSGLEKGLFDAAIVAQREGGYKTEPAIAENAEEIKEASGTKYLRIDMGPKLEEAVEDGNKKVAIVGTPCEVRAARKMQKVWVDESEDVDLTIIGLFCFESFDYEKLKEEVDEKLGVDLDAADKTQISKGKFIVQMNDEEYSCPVSELDEAVDEGCDFCDDFVSRLADVSVGSVGSPDGYSTVIVRSEVGEKLLEGIDFDKEEVNEEGISRLVSMKEDRAEKSKAPLKE